MDVQQACAREKQAVLDAYGAASNGYRDFPRFEARRWDEYAFNARLSFVSGGRLLDVGAGTNALNLLLARLGMQVDIVDDFGDQGYGDIDLQGVIERVLEPAGVGVHSLDVTANPLPFPDGHFDVAVSYGFFEHLHRGARHVLSEMHRVLRPGGRVVIGTPNAADLKKRLEVLAGRSAFSRLDDWFIDGVFRGHVREPTVGDLRRMLERTGFQVTRVAGRNWTLPRVPLAGVVDLALSRVPALCSNIYVVGRRR